MPELAGYGVSAVCEIIILYAVLTVCDMRQIVSSILIIEGKIIHIHCKAELVDEWKILS